MDQQIVVEGEAAKLAKELAELTHETVEAALIQAVRERLERQHEKATKVEALLALAKEIREHSEPGTTSDHSWLYGEDGLPI